MAISDAKWKYSRIAFDIAEAYKTLDGKVSLDDAVIMAATPSVVIDFVNSPDEDLRRVMQEMKRFLKSNSRFRTFNKAAIAEGLRIEWLPTLEGDDKLRLLSDIRLITGVTDDGFIEVEPTIFTNLTAKEHPDNEKYGSEPYSPKPLRRSSGGRSSGPRVVLNKVERDINIAAKLKPYIEWYKTNWEELQKLEDYKWDALDQFQKNFDIEAEDFSAMLNRSFANGLNLLASGSFYNPLGGIKRIAKFAPEETRTAFKALFDEQTPLARRVDDFLASFSEIYNRVAEGNFRPGPFDLQSERSVSVYLSFFAPQTYYIYKYSVWQGFKQQTDLSYPSLSDFESKYTGYQIMCDHVRDVLMQDGELLALLHNSRLEDNYNGTLLTQDFMYSIAVHFVDFNSQPRYYIENE